jgi:hypothetical protein
VSEPTDIEGMLRTIAGELRRLESEYTLFFAGRLPRPPWETRAKVEKLFKRGDRTYIDNTAQRFRFATLQARFASLAELWERLQRSRDEGVSGRGPRTRGEPDATPEGRAASARRPHARDGSPDEGAGRILDQVAIRDPATDEGRLRQLHETLASAQREAGVRPLSYERFSSVVGHRVRRLQRAGVDGSEFRVELNDGRVSLKVRGRRGGEDEEAGGGSGADPAPTNKR